MRFSLQREAFLKPLAQVVNVVERRQTLPVLANFLVQVQSGQLSLTGTDLEVEMISRSAVDDAQDGETTIPARKLFDIIRALPDGSKVTVSQTGDKVTVQAGRSRFTLATLPANDFPSVDEVEATERIEVPEATLKELIERTSFAMAQQDVRYYLNGLLFDLRGDALRTVATDGHRLALCETELEKASGAKRQIIVPRKGVTELQRLLAPNYRPVEDKDVLRELLADDLAARFPVADYQRWFASLLERMPGLGALYNSIRQMVDALSGRNKDTFRRVVMVEFPRPGMWSIAFVTHEQPTIFCEAIGKPVVNVFIPAAPAPTTPTTPSGS